MDRLSPCPQRARHTTTPQDHEQEIFLFSEFQKGNEWLRRRGALIGISGLIHCIDQVIMALMQAGFPTLFLSCSPSHDAAVYPGSQSIRGNVLSYERW